MDHSYAVRQSSHCVHAWAAKACQPGSRPLPRVRAAVQLCGTAITVTPDGSTTVRRAAAKPCEARADSWCSDPFAMLDPTAVTHVYGRRREKTPARSAREKCPLRSLSPALVARPRRGRPRLRCPSGSKSVFFVGEKRIRKRGKRNIWGEAKQGGFQTEPEWLSCSGSLFLAPKNMDHCSAKKKKGSLQ